MSEKTFVEEFQEAYDKSNGEWLELENGPIESPGVTGEMLRWFERNLNDDLYRKWCPGPHRSYKSLVFPDIQGEVIEESCAPYEACIMLVRHPPIEETVFANDLRVPRNRANYMEVFDLKNRILFKILHEFYIYPDKVVLYNRYRVPKALSASALKAFMDHQEEEYFFNKFLPKAFSEKTWMVKEECVLD